MCFVFSLRKFHENCKSINSEWVKNVFLKRLKHFLKWSGIIISQAGVNSAFAMDYFQMLINTHFVLYYFQKRECWMDSKHRIYPS